MTKIFIPVLFCAAAFSSYALPDYEPFGYTAGSNLIGQTGPDGQQWFIAAPTSATQPTVVTGGLTVPGLATTGNNTSVQFGGTGEAARLNLSSITGSGTVYYSFALKMSSLTGLSTSGLFFTGLNNTPGSQTTTPSQLVTRVILKSVSGGFEIGTTKSSSTASDFTFDTATTFTTADTIFIVGSYTFNTANNTDDVSKMWINPNSTTFNAVSAPAPTLQNAVGTDIASTQIASFVLYDRNTGTGNVDELRIGTSWADVTPPVPEPSLLALGGLGLAGLLARRRLRK